jgi:hypothetical protein
VRPDLTIATRQQQHVQGLARGPAGAPRQQADRSINRSMPSPPSMLRDLNPDPQPKPKPKPTGR